MSDLVGFFSDLGLVVSAPALDGQLHRVDHKDKPGGGTGWYVGWEAPYKIVIAGDWRSNIKGEWKDNNKARVSRDDRKRIEKQVAEAKQRAEWERSEIRRQCALEAQELLKGARPGAHPYLSRKQLEKLDALVLLDELLIPMADDAGRVWGVQRIAKDGKKLFLAGQRVKGLAYCFKGDPELVYLAEGFATGGSLHIATGATVYCAFSAGNMVEVAKWLRDKHPTAAITVCGDDDQWSAGNPGRQKATEAAERAQAAVVFPQFKDLKTKPTDFNDLHLLEGLDTLRAQLEEPEGLSKLMVPLGQIGTRAYFYETQTQSLVNFEAYSHPEFFQLAPLEYWQQRYPAPNSKDAEKVNWIQAKSDLAQISKRIGHFDSTRVRGPGVWLDRSKNNSKMNVIVNTGHTLYMGGKELSASRYGSKNVYVRGHKLPSPIGQYASVAECAPLIKACEVLNWEAPEAHVYLAGWLAIAGIAGALPIRPHVWIIAAAGAGKSTILTGIIKRALPTYNAYQGETTAAGIRQAQMSASIPVVFDEFETDETDASEKRRNQIIELFRQGWSPTDGSIVKGSVDGVATPWQIAFSALVCSVRYGANQEADRTRFTTLELKKHTNQAQQWDTVRAAIGAIPEGFGELLWRRSIQLVETIRINSEKLKAAFVAKGESQRWADQHSLLVAGYHSLRSEGLLTDSEIEELLTKCVSNPDREGSGGSEERELLTKIFTSKIWANREMVSLGSLIDPARRSIVNNEKSDLSWCTLEKNGIRVELNHVLISNTHDTLERILSKSKWKKNWGKILARLPNAERRSTTRFHDHASRGVALPISLFFDNGE